MACKQWHSDPQARGVFSSHLIEDFLALPGVSTDSKRKIVWDNCLRLYQFPENAL
jgi:hypothetical protein